ncbi:MAG: MFS transporter [Chloroflexota bacterium]|nr:MAG: MFS transporter [Chloroflexota bacterium]
MSSPGRDPAPGVSAALADAPTTMAPPVERNGTFAALAIRDFRLLLIGTTLSNAAQWIQQVTLGWLVYEWTGSGTALGTINLVRSGPALLLAPLAGIAIDRIDRRPLMVATQGFLFVISLGLGVALAIGFADVRLLFLFALLGGAAQTVDLPLRQTATFDLVPRSQAPNAVALVQTGWSLMRSLGPALGGALILWFGPSGNFFIQASAYGLIALAALAIRFPPRRVLPGARAGVWRNMADGFRFIAGNRVTRTFVMMGWVLPLVIIPIFSALPPIYAKDVFGGGPETLGILMSAVGVGGIVGGFITASLGRLERRGVIQLVALAGTSVSLGAFALSPDLLTALPLLALSGAFEMVYLTTNQTLLQLSIPDEMRGRVTSIVSLSMVLAPVGAIFAGTGSDLVGPRAITAVLSVIGLVIAVAVFIGSSTVREYRLSQGMAPARHC